MGSSDVDRVAVLYSELTGYMTACLRAFRRRCGVEYFVYAHPPSSNAPFEHERFDVGDLRYKSDQGVEEIVEQLRSFGPEVLLISGWVDGDYLKAARRLKAEMGDRILVVAGCDTQPDNSWKQTVGSWIAPWYLHSAIDVLWVAGDRQRQFAHQLGYRGPYLWDGFYACDHPEFEREEPGGNPLDRPRFVFVGKYIRRKGIDVLVEAYGKYREAVEDPWDLVCVGTGEREELLQQQRGVNNLGFVQPDELAGVLRDGTVFVLPSREEPWGVVIHEATAARLPVICTEACGAAVHLVRDGYNGYVLEPGSVRQLYRGLRHVSRLSADVLRTMGRRSLELSRQFTPQLWAETFVRGLDGVPGAGGTESGGAQA